MCLLFIVQELACSISYSINETINPHIPSSPKINPSPQVPLVWNQLHISPKRKKQLCPAKKTNKEERTKDKQEATGKLLMWITILKHKKNPINIPKVVYTQTTAEMSWNNKLLWPRQLNQVPSGRPAIPQGSGAIPSKTASHAYRLSTVARRRV